MRPFIVEFLGTPEAGKTTSVKMLRRSLEEKGYKVGLVRESAEIVPDMFKTGFCMFYFLHSNQLTFQSNFIILNSHLKTK